ncbi:MAG: phospholipid/cholesterol/gamma-HCH transport system substrate-binding protein, partial [Mycobacterium sp.]|nr:phospholipid/cholesterol/gamma-HCH transport system substrate-binding protein [Mycobacterium sp.]
VGPDGNLSDLILPPPAVVGQISPAGPLPGPSPMGAGALPGPAPTPEAPPLPAEGAGG